MGLQIGLQALFALLLVFVVFITGIDGNSRWGLILAASVAIAVAYALILLSHTLRSAARRIRAQRIWFVVLALLWIALVIVTPYAAYLVFPLFFLALDISPPRWEVPLVLLLTAASIGALGVHGEWTVGGVVGPIIGAGVALLIGMSSLALRRESEAYERLYTDLLATQGRLAASERAAGVLAERERLAREIHDTVAQGLSSITLLLSAAERKDPASAARSQVSLAREAATASLAEARRFVRELVPPPLDEQSLGGALRRLAASAWAASELEIDIRVADALEIAMPIQTALLRVTQGAMANVVAHSSARHACIEIVREPDVLVLTVEDDGVGFDQTLVERDAEARGSFGLRATRERVEQFGGSVRISTQPGQGTRMTVRIPDELQ